MAKLPFKEVVDEFLAKRIIPPTISLCRLPRLNRCAFHPALLLQKCNRVNVTTWPVERDYNRFMDDIERQCYAI